MKAIKILIPTLTGILFAAAANAQTPDVNMTLTGSTSFRLIVLDRAQTLFDPGYTSIGDPVGALPITYFGTMSNAIPALGSQTVAMRMSFSGSATGMLAVDQGTPVPTRNPDGSTNNLVPDLALSDVYPESATPPINPGDFDQDVLGVIPFVWTKNNALTGITNITREQAYDLMTDSGPFGMPASFLGGTSGGTIYLTGRDAGSGTRITTFKDIGFTGSPTQWQTNGVGGYTAFTLGGGFSSGGLERSTVAGGSQVIGYLGEGDALAIAATASTITYEGVAMTHTNVATGKYPMWGYEHIVNIAGMSGTPAALRDALKAKITDFNYQHTNNAYFGSQVPLGDMQVNRGTDGGPINRN